MRVKRTIQITGEETKGETEQLNITSTKHTVSGSPYPKTKGTIKVEIEAQYIKNEERPETKAIPQQSHHQEERIIAKSTPMEVVSKEWNCCEGIGS